LKKFNNLKASGNPFRIDSFENIGEELKINKKVESKAPVNVIENKKLISSADLD
jgi:hypothetical protein